MFERARLRAEYAFYKRFFVPEWVRRVDDGRAVLCYAVEVGNTRFVIKYLKAALSGKLGWRTTLVDGLSEWLVYYAARGNQVKTLAEVLKFVDKGLTFSGYDHHPLASLLIGDFNKAVKLLISSDKVNAVAYWEALKGRTTRQQDMRFLACLNYADFKTLMPRMNPRGEKYLPELLKGSMDQYPGLADKFSTLQKELLDTRTYLGVACEQQTGSFLPEILSDRIMRFSYDASFFAFEGLVKNSEKVHRPKLGL